MLIQDGNKKFLLSALVCGFFISMQYAIIRPVSHSVFIDIHGTQPFAYAWIAMIPINLGCVALYNRFLPVLGCWRMFVVFTALVMGSLMMGSLWLDKVWGFAFGFYIWKEIYVMLFFQQLWSVIHATVSVDKAKYWYGILFAVGGLGGALGSMGVGLCAETIGSMRLMLCALPCFPFLLMSYFIVLRHGNHEQRERKKSPSFGEGFVLIRHSSLLLFILCIVVLMQVCSTLVEYQFNTLLAEKFSDLDMRTSYTGKLFAWVNGSTVVLQLFGTALFVHVFGLKGGHLFVPLVLGLSGIALVLFPVFGLASFAYATIKSFDFSLFGVIKEMLYIPLKIEEKFQAKAVIDVFAYRSAKAVASLLVIAAPFYVILWESVALCALWVVLVWMLFKHYEKRASSALS